MDSYPTDGDIEDEGEESDSLSQPQPIGSKNSKVGHKRQSSNLDKATPDRESLHIDDMNTPNVMSSSK